MSKNKLRFKDELKSGSPAKVKISDIASLKNGYAFSTKEYSIDGDYRVITISNVQGKRFIDTKGCKKISKLPSNIAAHQMLKENDVLITLTGNVGRVSLCSGDKLLLNQRVGLLELSNLVNREFIFQQLRNGKFEESMIMQGQGGAQPNISKSDIDNYEISLPSLPEQEKIAALFSKLDERIELREQKIASLKEYKKGLQQAVFGNNGERALRFKDKNGNDYPDWVEKTLDEVAECLDSKRKPLNSSQRSSMVGDVPYYGANNIQGYVNKHLFEEPLVLLAEDGGNFDDYKNKPIAQYIEGKSWVNNHAHVIKGKNISTKFLFYSLVHKDIRSFINGTSRAKLNKSDMLKIEISIPCLEEQEKIANLFSKIDNQIELEEQLLQAAKDEKQGLMQRVF